MTLGDIDAVRLLTSDKSLITRETAKGDGLQKYFKLGHRNISTSPTLEVRVSGAINTDWTLDADQGIVTFTVTPAASAQVDFTYYWSIFSDAEIQYFVDAAGGNTTIAAAKVLLAIAADASKVAQRQSLAGGGGLGAVTLDTSVTARELRNTAKALIEMEGDIGASIPAEGLTELAWNEFSYQEITAQDLIRES